MHIRLECDLITHRYVGLCCWKTASILILLAVSHSNAPQSKTHLRFVDVATDQELPANASPTVSDAAEARMIQLKSLSGSF